LINENDPHKEILLLLLEDKTSSPQIKYVLYFCALIPLMAIAMRLFIRYQSALEDLSNRFYAVKLYRERNNM